MSNKRIVILGAGLTGLSTAYFLQRHIKDISVFEKEKEVGGLCRSKIKDGFIFDYAGHLLHFRQKRIYLWIKE
ncbi:MAG: FAD-dependent oxidoreductase, partial [Candidatus Omnitrophica bacterium]|nr:FAD-dependent oxidoreductase [Candidatus Omnitrophota bacterium]